MIGYMCAYLRCYYPAEFIVAYLNNADNDDDIIMGQELAKVKNIQIKPIEFQKSSGEYFYSKEENVIYKGIGSIKFLNNAVGKELHDLSKKVYRNFVDVLSDLKKKTSLKKNQLEILIKLNFFKKFGEANQLMAVAKLYDQFGSSKIISKQKLDNLGIPYSLVRPCATSETEKQFRDIHNTKLISNLLSLSQTCPMTIKEHIEYEKEYAGDVSYTNKNLAHHFYVLDVDTLYSPKIKVYSLYSGETHLIKINSRIFKKQKIKEGDVINLSKCKKRPKYFKTEKGWEIRPGEFDIWVETYKKVIL